MKDPARNKSVLTPLLYVVNMLRARTPFLETNAIWQSLVAQGDSILDVGCGKGTIMNQMVSARKTFRFATGVDIFRLYLTSCKLEGVYNELVLCDCRNLPFRAKSFDLVLCSNVIEHLEKEDGIELLNNLDTIAERRIVVVTPMFSYPEVSIKNLVDHNPFQKHRSKWLPFEFESRGYKVRGQGLHIKAKSQQGALWTLIRTRQDETKAKSIYSLIYRNLRFILDLIAGPFVRRYFRLADLLICVKDFPNRTFVSN